MQRRRHPDDRRVVLVEVLDHCGPHIAPLYRALHEELMKVNARYSNRELDVVVRYLTEALEAGARHVAWLQTQPALSHHRPRHRALRVNRSRRQRPPGERAGQRHAPGGDAASASYRTPRSGTPASVSA